MIVCICHRVSDRDIASEVRQGCASFDELQDELRVGTACGRCTDCARATFREARAVALHAPVHAQAHAPRERRVIPVAAVHPLALAA